MGFLRSQTLPQFMLYYLLWQGNFGFSGEGLGYGSAAKVHLCRFFGRIIKNHGGLGVMWIR